MLNAVGSYKIARACEVNSLTYISSILQASTIEYGLIETLKPRGHILPTAHSGQKLSAWHSVRHGLRPARCSNFLNRLRLTPELRCGLSMCYKHGLTLVSVAGCNDTALVQQWGFSLCGAVQTTQHCKCHLYRGRRLACDIDRMDAISMRNDGQHKRKTGS